MHPNNALAEIVARCINAWMRDSRNELNQTQVDHYGRGVLEAVRGDLSRLSSPTVLTPHEGRLRQILTDGGIHVPPTAGYLEIFISPGHSVFTERRDDGQASCTKIWDARYLMPPAQVDKILDWFCTRLQNKHLFDLSQVRGEGSEARLHMFRRNLRAHVSAMTQGMTLHWRSVPVLTALALARISTKLFDDGYPEGERIEELCIRPAREVSSRQHNRPPDQGASRARLIWSQMMG